MARDEINAFLGTGTTYQGKLDFQGSVRIDGTFKGEVTSKGTLVVGKDANVEGTIQVGQLIISGKLEGEVQALEKVVLHKTANIVGRINAPVLVMEEGAVLEGEISMGTKGQAKPLRTAASAGPQAPGAPAAAPSQTVAKPAFPKAAQADAK